MTGANDDTTRLLLQRVAVGELNPDDPEVRAKAAVDPWFAAALTELVADQSRLDRAAAAERAWLDHAAAPVPAGATRDVVGETLRRLAEVGVGPRRVEPRGESSRRGVWLGLAALAAAVLLWWALDGRRPPRNDGPLGQKDVELLQPAVADGVLILGWTSELVDAEFLVTIQRADDATSKAALSIETTDREWRIPANLWQPLRAANKAWTWRVTASANGQEFTAEDRLRLPD